MTDESPPSERLGDVSDDFAGVACDINDVASKLDDRERVRADGGTTATTADASEQWRLRPVDDGYRQTMSRFAFGGRRPSHETTSRTRSSQ